MKTFEKIDIILVVEIRGNETTEIAVRPSLYYNINSFCKCMGKNEENESIMSKGYEFYDSKKEGFNSIADMFK